MPRVTVETNNVETGTGQEGQCGMEMQAGWGRLAGRWVPQPPFLLQPVITVTPLPSVLMAET